MTNKIEKSILVFFIISLFFLRSFAQQMDDYAGMIFPADHALNMAIDSLPVHPNSDVFVNSIGPNKSLHPDMGNQWNDDGTFYPLGIPYNFVGSGQPLVPITWTLYGDESDPGPWPIPPDPYIEGVFDWKTITYGDRHLLVVDTSAGILYETGNAYGNSDGSEWEGGCGAVFDLNDYELRPETWTSADAAGLPIFPLLIRYDEVERALSGDGVVHHAIRFTTDTTRREYIWPARHYASSRTESKWPPMGLRFRLKANVDISGFSERMQVILRTMKKYGIIVSDNGGDWFFQSSHDTRWDDEDINTLKAIHGRDFEAVDITPWMEREGFDINSAKVPGVITKVEENNLQVSEFNLFQNFPNPFNPTTTIAYNLPPDGNNYKVTLKIYNLLGQEEQTLINDIQNSGRHLVKLNGTSLSSGVYFYELKAQSGNNHLLIARKKLCLIK